jgi:hypothetical protein
MTAVRSIAIALGIAAAAVLVLSVVADERALEAGWLAWWPECSARRAGGACTLCGMSHSFVALARGRVEEARGHNPAGPWLYASLVTQLLVSICVTSGTFRKRRCLPKRTG